ncbi:LPS-assembly protein LptD [Herminiimonas fonticola]|uniref:LPS-assembly protein LptD n=1 Tax=Herminiimonas fonticola TaxID=303380 RepID=UPI0033427467
MTWLFSFRSSQRFATTLTAVVAAVSASTFASAQTAVKPAKVKDPEAETRVSSEQMTGRPDREIILERDVEIIRGETTLNADHATYWIAEDEVEASGNVRMNRFGDRYTGDKMRFKMDEGKGYVTNPTYHMQGNNAQGQAERIDFEAEDRALITQGTYSTCEGPDPDWYLKSNTMHLDTGKDVGTAGTTMIYFKGVPILGTPYMSFPLSDARKSGMLVPTMGTTSTGGFEVMVPYYFNIAPNRDLTLFPKYIARRGFQLGAEARYLDRDYAGETKIEFLPNDTQTKTNRYSIASTHAQRLSPQASFGWNVKAASDDDYAIDFSRNLATSTERLLLRDLYFNYAEDFWSATARASNYQVLQDVLAPITRPYDRLPQLTLQAGRQDVNGFDWATTVEATRFWHPDLVRGERYVVNPSLSYPIVRPSYFVTPKVSLNAASYSVQDPLTRANSSYNRTLPTFSLDSGLIFERETNIFGEAATQTLEPRLFYVKTPYRNQANPVFDSAEADLSFAQIFSENRFIGNDRISDANQLTTALVSRYIESSGAERLRVALAQRFYFEDQRVTLPGVVPQGDNKSDILASGTLRISNALSTEGNLQYSSTQKTVSRGNASVSWRPEPKKVLNLAYRVDVPNALRQVDVSGQWPLGDRWYGVGRMNYSLSNDYANRPGYKQINVPPKQGLSEGLLGLEYKADCWIFRVVAQRIPTATGKSTTSLFFQLELSGLTKLGSDPMEALRTSIPGYQAINKPSNINY